jgi:hypothetical protein
MKNKILILLLTLVSFVGYSQRVLTDDERQTLSTSETFKQKCQWAVRNYATYWSGHDGSGLTTTAQKMKWAKDRISSVEILKNNTVDQDIARLKLLAGCLLLLQARLLLLRHGLPRIRLMSLYLSILI